MNWLSDTTVATGDRVEVNVPDTSSLLTDLSARLEARRGFCVATLNLDHLVKLRSTPDFRDVYSKFTHVTADGNPIVWLCRLSGQNVSLVPGSELIDPVMERAAAADTPVALFGASDTSLQTAADALRVKYPGIQIVLTLAPPMGFDPQGLAADEAISAIKASGARLCAVALGAPKQEIFAIRAQAEMPECGFLCIGAGLDFISGAQTRAPALVRKLALEWAWRMLANPSRLAGRYARCAALLPGLTYHALRTRYSKQ